LRLIDFVSLNSRLESNDEDEEGHLKVRVSRDDAELVEQPPVPQHVPDLSKRVY